MERQVGLSYDWLEFVLSSKVLQSRSSRCNDIIIVLDSHISVHAYISDHGDHLGIALFDDIIVLPCSTSRSASSTRCCSTHASVVRWLERTSALAKCHRDFASQQVSKSLFPAHSSWA